MRRALAMGLLAVGLSFLLPVLLRAGTTGDRAPASHLRPPVQTAERGDGGVGVRVQLADGSVERMSRADYLWGVVAAEMPASFHTEALKAQAVAARTYLVCAKQDKHPGAEICADSKCCQAYVSRAEAEAGWGERAGEYGAKLSEAVDGTDGLVLLYEGRPIQALYFSSAPGSTVDARAVWGNHVPYLVSVASPEGERVPDYHSQLTLSGDELRGLVQDAYPQAELSGPCEGWLSEVEREPSGTVSRLKVGGAELTGGQLRKLLGLRSACFTVSVKEDVFTFHVTGYGHGVGMSQYGANELAGQGKDFRQILQWYYTGVELAVY